MRVRYRTDGTRRILHLSDPPFTVAPEDGEADCIIIDAPFPDSPNRLRLSADLVALEVDPALVPPPAARGRDFRLTLLTLVDGATDADKLERADTLWADPKVAAWMQMLNNEALRPEAINLVRKRWAKLKTLGIPSADEITRVEAAAPSFGISLQ